jgi:hypothetical protein
LYSDYCKGYGPAMEEVFNQMKVNKSFETYVKNFETVVGATIESVLVKPVQVICVYIYIYVCI